jgi:CHAT domain-containing protein
MSAHRTFLALGLAFFASACSTGGATPDATTASALGKTLAGEECRLQPRAAASRDGAILCGDEATPSGRLAVIALPAALPADAVARRQAVERAARNSAVGADIAARMKCDTGSWIARGKDELLVSACTERGSDWPHIVLAGGAGTQIFIADGLPSMLPALDAALAQAAHWPPGDSGAVQAIAARLPAKALGVTSRDFARYQDLIRQARIDNGMRNYAGAESADRRILAIETGLFDPASPAIGDALTELALQVSNQGRFDEAASLFRRAEPIVASAPSAILRARFSSYLALDAANRRHFDEALRYAREATALRRTQQETASLAAVTTSDAGDEAASLGDLVQSLRIEAEMALRLNDMASARAAMTEALKIITEQRNLPLWWRPDLLASLGDIDAADDRSAAAERDYRDALALRQKLFGDSAPAALSYLALGAFYANQQSDEEAVTAFRAAFAILDRDAIARATVEPDEIIPFIAAATRLAEHDPKQRAALETDIFRASQLVGAGVADQTVARVSLRLAAGDPALSAAIREVQDAERKRDTLRLALAEETAKPDEERSRKREDALAQALGEASATATRLQKKRQADFPAYTGFAEPGPVDLATLRGHLRPGEGFFSLVAGESEAYALLVERDRLTVRRLPAGRAAFAKDVGELRRALAIGLGKPVDFDLRLAFTTYRQLLAPLAPDLARLNALTASLSGPLASLPLALLVSEPPAAGREHDYISAAWLVRRLAVTQVPSARSFIVLREAQQHRVPAPKPILAVGAPDFAGPAGGAGRGGAIDTLATECREDGPIAGNLLRALPRLPDTVTEVETATRLLGGDASATLIGANATEANLRRQPLEQFAVLYFATHGLLPGELHCQSEPGLALSPPAQAARSTDEDGLLDAAEIAGFHLNADLVVLSACNTAAGGRFGGEALSGLAAAFFNAGARTLLVSHWEVPSDATRRLMGGVLAGDGGIAEALRQAQLALIAQPATAHPFYWAAFTVVGDGAPALKRVAAPAKRSAS